MYDLGLRWEGLDKLVKLDHGCSCNELEFPIFLSTDSPRTLGLSAQSINQSVNQSVTFISEAEKPVDEHKKKQTTIAQFHQD